MDDPRQAICPGCLKPVAVLSPLFFTITHCINFVHASACEWLVLSCFRSPCIFDGLWKQPTGRIPCPGLESAPCDAADLTEGVLSPRQDKS